MSQPEIILDPELDLLLERYVELPPEAIWAAWTTPELYKEWFCPRPWTVAEAELDLRPGGGGRTVMRPPEGEDHISFGCYLEVVPNRRLIFTDAMTAGYRPAAKPFMTGIIDLVPEGTGTRYRAIARHADAATREQHEAMGFHQGWSIALDQLIELMKRR